MSQPQDAERYWQRVGELFTRALEQRPEERQAFLDEACAGHPALRAELESLLTWDRADDDFLEHSPLAALNRSNHGSDGATLEGQRFGPYRAGPRVGTGGMGSVYRATRADAAYAKEVAVKVIKPGTDSRTMAARFERERHAVARLEHPNIARLIDGGTTPDGRLYIVMEYVDGVRLDRYCDEHTLSTEARLRLFLRVCDAVAHAHRNLIVHRDLKPDNILVTKDGVPKLVDFGVAKLLDPEDDEHQTLTVAGVDRPMTMRYASPEQVAGGPIPTSTDVYSLGVVLYEILTGHLPYRLESGKQGEIERAIREHQPERPSAAVGRVETIRAGRGNTRTLTPDLISRTREGSPQKLRRRLSGDLDTILLMALRKEPDRRYSSVEQFADDIRRYLAGEPVLARKDTLSYRTARFIGRHKTGTAAAALVFIFLLGGIGLAAWQAQLARQEANKARQLNEFVNSMLGAASPWREGRSVTVAEVLDAAARRIDIELAGDPEIEAEVRLTIGTSYLGLGLFDDAEPHLRRALEIRRGLHGNVHVEVAGVLERLTELLNLKGSFNEAEDAAREALAIRRQVHGEVSVEVATALNRLASVLLSKGDLDGAEQLRRAALDVLRDRGGEHRVETAQIMNSLGTVVGTKGNMEEAERLHREALAILREVYGPRHPDVAHTLNNVATLLSMRPEGFDEADHLFREVLEMRRDLLGSDYPDVTWTLYNYAFLMLDKGDYDDAISLSREVLALRGKTLGDEHPMVASTLVVLGRSLLALGDAAAAEPALRESLTLRRKNATGSPLAHRLGRERPRRMPSRARTMGRSRAPGNRRVRTTLRGIGRRSSSHPGGCGTPRATAPPVVGQPSAVVSAL